MTRGDANGAMESDESGLPLNRVDQASEVGEAAEEFWTPLNESVVELVNDSIASQPASERKNAVDIVIAKEVIDVRGPFGVGAGEIASPSAQMWRFTHTESECLHRLNRPRDGFALIDRARGTHEADCVAGPEMAGAHGGRAHAGRRGDCFAGSQGAQDGRRWEGLQEYPSLHGVDRELKEAMKTAMDTLQAAEIQASALVSGYQNAVSEAGT